MKKYCILITLFLFANTLFATNYNKVLKDINEKIKKEADIELSINSCKPDKRITKLMFDINNTAQTVLQDEDKENDEDKAVSIYKTCLALIEVLKERRIYSYMLWAEGRLNMTYSTRYEKLSKLTQSELLNLYSSLSEINISLISENMLNREIMNRLSEIYDNMDKQHKQMARIGAIDMQKDPLSKKNSKVRKSFDDF